jgi:hypothetical protein
MFVTRYFIGLQDTGLSVYAMLTVLQDIRRKRVSGAPNLLPQITPVGVLDKVTWSWMDKDMDMGA